MVCTECPHLEVRKTNHGGRMDFSLFCEENHYCIGYISIPTIECSGHQHEWHITFKDGKVYLKCSICGQMKLHQVESGSEIKREKEKLNG